MATKNPKLEGTTVTSLRIPRALLVKLKKEAMDRSIREDRYVTVTDIIIESLKKRSAK